MEKLDFLKSYCTREQADIQILKTEDIANIDKNILPEKWYAIFEMQNIAERIRVLLDIWQQYVPQELSETIYYLQSHVINAELFRINENYSVLYTIRKDNNEVIYYVGENTIQTVENTMFQSVWEKIPESIRNFYENVHNGFYDYRIDAMGLVSLQQSTYFADDDIEWGIIEDLEQPLQIDINQTYSFFETSMGGYVAVDISQEEKIENAVVWFSDDQPEYHVNFWDVVDEWILIGIEAE